MFDVHLFVRFRFDSRRSARVMYTPSFFRVRTEIRVHDSIYLSNDYFCFFFLTIKIYKLSFAARRLSHLVNVCIDRSWTTGGCVVRCTRGWISDRGGMSATCCGRATASPRSCCCSGAPVTGNRLL